jgi:exopolyphosphatase/guanosine-5'-triphosphate,3'-diphosphate pyrophosphatase
MQYKVFAAIDIGSYEVGMKIFELSRAKGMKEIDSIRQRLELGRDAYTEGKISVEKIESLCTLLQSFKEIMEGYKVNAYRACATSAIRETKNRVIILDYIEKKTGLKIEVLSNSEQRFLDYKSIASSENDFNTIIQKATAIIDVGGGSIQMSLFDKDRLISTQNIRIGNLRIRERLAPFEKDITHIERLIEEMVSTELMNFKKMYLKDREIQNLIVVGDNFREVAKVPTMSRDEFYQLYELVTEYSPDEAAEKLDVPSENIHILLPSLVIHKWFVDQCGVETIWLPGFHLSDGMAYEYAQQNKIIKAGHDFEGDIIAAARSMAKRYMCSKTQIKELEDLALEIFDKTKKVHGLDARKRLLLQIAAILHDCGKYISLSDVAECSYSIIMATEIIGLSDVEREMIANIVRFNTQEFSYYENVASQNMITKEEYLIVAKLTAILRVANALDRSHRQKFSNVRISLRDTSLVITVETSEDISLETGLFPEKADFFQEVFSVRPVIKKKRIR